MVHSLVALLCYMKQNSSRLAGNPNWGTATVVGVFAGLLYGGSKEASASVVCLHSIITDESSLLLRKQTGLVDHLRFRKI